MASIGEPRVVNLSGILIANRPVGPSDKLAIGPKLASKPDETRESPGETFVPSSPSPVKPDRPRLIVIDNHLPPPSLSLPGLFSVVEHAVQKETHGTKVVNTARAQGYQGTVYPLELRQAPTYQSARMDVAAGEVWEKNESRGQLRSALYAEVLSSRVMVLSTLTQDLEFLNQQNVTGTVVNASLGASLAGSVTGILDKRFGEKAAEDKEEGYEGKRLCLALDCDREKLISTDKQVARRESHLLLQRLFDLAESTSDDLEYVAIKSRYHAALQEFVDKGNSLVVSASNDGDVSEALTWLSETPMELPSRYQVNDLAHPLAVVVGATRADETGVKVAPYSSDYQGVNFYASGQAAGGDGQGTSFAAPRVAAVLAQLHFDQQGETSAAIENTLRQKFSTTLQDYEGHQQAPVLNEAAAQEYLFSRPSGG